MTSALHGVAYAAQISQAAQRHDLDPRLLAAVAAQETGGPGSGSGRNVVGDGGHGHGLFQIDDRCHAFAATPAAMNPGANADYAAGMISGLLRQYGGDVHKALSAYNAGSPDAQGSVTQWQDGTRLGYADSVMRHYADLGGQPAQPSISGAPETAPAPADPLLEMVRAESPAEQRSVNDLKSYANTQATQTSPFADLIFDPAGI